MKHSTTRLILPVYYNGEHTVPVGEVAYDKLTEAKRDVNRLVAQWNSDNDMEDEPMVNTDVNFMTIEEYIDSLFGG